MLSWSLLAIWFVNLDSWSDSVAFETQLWAQLLVPSVHLHSSPENDFSFLYFFCFCGAADGGGTKWGGRKRKFGEGASVSCHYNSLRSDLLHFQPYSAIHHSACDCHLALL